MTNYPRALEHGSYNIRFNHRVHNSESACSAEEQGVTTSKNVIRCTLI